MSTPEELYSRIGGGLLNAAPSDWTELGITCVQAGSMAQYQAWVVLANGERLPLRGVARHVSESFDELRDLLYQEGRGTWFTAQATVTRDLRIAMDLDYDEEPAWGTSVVPETYAEDLQKYHRDEAHRPLWLREKLSEARG